LPHINQNTGRLGGRYFAKKPKRKKQHYLCGSV